MNKEIYSLKDTKSGFLNPFYEVNEECAIRGISTAMSNTKNDVLYVCAQDFELWKLGTFDTTTGAITVDNGPTFVVSLMELKNKIKE